MNSLKRFLFSRSTSLPPPKRHRWTQRRWGPSPPFRQRQGHETDGSAFLTALAAEAFLLVFPMAAGGREDVPRPKGGGMGMEYLLNPVTVLTPSS